MKIFRHLLLGLIIIAARLTAGAQQTPAAAAEQQATTTAAAAATVTGQVPPPPDILESIVDEILQVFDVRSHENTVTHFTIAAIFLIAGLLLRRVVTALFFAQLKKMASRTSSTFDDKLLPALESPAATFVMLVGIFAALNVLKLPDASDQAVEYGRTVAFSLVVFWGLIRAFGAVLDHLQEIAQRRKMGVAAFMPWIKKTLISIFAVFGVLMVVQSLGFDVKALLAGLGIGGLAFALAAQDTLANVFGSVVVAIDQPFKIGEAIRVAGNTGTVEDIGLRSTKLRLADRSLMAIPNKLVAAEAITNFSRFTARRVEQVLSLTYAAKADQLEGIVADIRALINAEPEVNPAETQVWFRDLNASSLDVWVVYMTKSPDFVKSMALRQRLNLAFMRAVEARGLEFAYPTQTLHIASVPGRDDPRVASGVPPAGRG